jgi:hypothetical protein
MLKSECCLYQKSWEVHEICFPWSLVVAEQLQEACKNTVKHQKLLALKTASLYPGFSYVHQIPTLSSTPQKTLSDQITLAKTMKMKGRCLHV